PVDRHEVPIDAEGDDGDAVLETDVLDVTDLDAGDPQRLTLPGHDRLRGLELRLELERPLLDERDPEPLALDDHVCRGEPDDEQERDRDEVAEVLADRDAHPPSPVP